MASHHITSPDAPILEIPLQSPCTNKSAYQSIKLLWCLNHPRIELRLAQILNIITCHNPGQSKLVNREPGRQEAGAGKPGQIGEM